jgi:hypothetical protein
VDHLRHVGSGHRNQITGFFCGDVPGWGNKARVWHEARDVSASPLHDLASAGPTIDKDGEVSIEDDMKAFDFAVFRSQYFAGVQMAKLAMLGDPGNLLLGNSCENPVSCQTIEKFLRHAWIR